MYLTNSSPYIDVEECDLSAQPGEESQQTLRLVAIDDTEVEVQGEIEEDQIDVAEVGRNCRIDQDSKSETVRLYQELLELKCWFENYGSEGVLFPRSIINSFAPLSRAA